MENRNCNVKEKEQEQIMVLIGTMMISLIAVFCLCAFILSVKPEARDGAAVAARPKVEQAGIPEPETCGSELQVPGQDD